MSWTCRHCSASVDDQMNACWQCGASKEGSLDPEFKIDLSIVPEHACPECNYPLKESDITHCPECGTYIEGLIKDIDLAEEDYLLSVKNFRRRVRFIVLFLTLSFLLPIFHYQLQDDSVLATDYPVIYYFPILISLFGLIHALSSRDKKITPEEREKLVSDEQVASVLKNIRNRD